MRWPCNVGIRKSQVFDGIESHCAVIQRLPRKNLITGFPMLVHVYYLTLIRSRYEKIFTFEPVYIFMIFWEKNYNYRSKGQLCGTAEASKAIWEWEPWPLVSAVENLLALGRPRKRQNLWLSGKWAYYHCLLYLIALHLGYTCKRRLHEDNETFLPKQST